MDNESDFSVGYKKPPRETRFKPGHSGNSSGRPKKKSVSVAEAFARELNASISVSEGGKSKKMTKLAAIAKQQINNALKGNHNATALVMKAVEPREIDTDENLFPVLAAMRAIHTSHEIAHPKVTTKPARSSANDKLENDGAEQR